jgi:serine/threonine-protein kinase
MLYELLTGKLPFNLAGALAGATPDFAVEIISRTPNKPSVVAGLGRGLAVPSRAVWADLDVLVLTAMHPDRARRYPTVEALLRDVDHFTAGEPLEARPDELGYRAGKFVRRHARALAATGAALALVVGLVVFYTVRITRARNSAVVEARRAERIQRFMLSLFDGGDKTRGCGPGCWRRRWSTVASRRRAGSGPSRRCRPISTRRWETTTTAWAARLCRHDAARALDQRRALAAATTPPSGAAWSPGLLRGNQARFDEAERLVRDGLATAQRTLRGGPRRHREAQGALARCWKIAATTARRSRPGGAVARFEAAAPGSVEWRRR